MKDCPYMIFVVDVREDKRALLGAITHVDGSARIQTVSRKTNARYWNLINEFKALTGVPVILNTSFNNNAEPIVDSTEDAVVCFLTTNLHYLVVGDHLVSKKEITPSTYRCLIPDLPLHVRLVEAKRCLDGRFVMERSILSNADDSFRHSLSAEAYALLQRADGVATLDDLLMSLGTDDTCANRLLTEIADLWSSRAITLTPSA